MFSIMARLAISPTQVGFGSVDDLAEKAQRKLAAKLQIEQQRAEITKARDERFAALEAKKSPLK